MIKKLLIGLLITTQTLASYTPTTVGTVKNVTKITAPNNQVTDMGRGSVHLETGNNNLLANPSFEAPLAGGAAPSWSTPDATLAIETTDAFHGKQALKATYSAKPIDISQSSTLNAAAFVNGANGVRSIAVKTSIAYTSTLRIYVCGVYAGVLKATSDGTSINDCKEVNNNGSWGEYVYPSTLGATSNGIAVVSLNPTTGDLVNVTGDVFIDKAEVSQTNRVGIAPVVTDWVDFTPAPINGFAAGYTVNIAKYRQVGSNAEINMFITMNGAFNNVVRIDPPPGLIFDFSKFSAGGVANLINSVGGDTFAGVLTNDSGGRLLISSATNIGTGYWSNTSSTPRVVAAGDFVSISVSIPIVGWSSSTSYLADTASSFSTNTNPLYFKATAIVDSDPVGTFNTYSYAINTNTKTICATAPTQSIADMKTNGIQIFTRAYNAASTCGNPARVEVKLASAGTSLPTLSREIYKNDVTTTPRVPGSFSLYSYDAGNNLRGAFVNQYEQSTGVYVLDFGISEPVTTIRTIFYSDVMPDTSGYLVINAQKAKDTMVAEITDMAKSEGSGGVDIQSVYFGSGADCSSVCSTGTCTICRKLGNKITSVFKSGTTGVYFINGLDKAVYICSGSGTTLSAPFSAAIGTNLSGSTSSYILTTGSGQDVLNASVTCIGTK